MQTGIVKDVVLNAPVYSKKVMVAGAQSGSRCGLLITSRVHQPVGRKKRFCSDIAEADWPGDNFNIPMIFG